MNSRERSLSKETYVATWENVDWWIWNICDYLDRCHKDRFKFVYGIPRGGLIPAVYISHKIGAKFLTRTDDYIGSSWNNILIVEDVVDTGKSIRTFQKFYSDMPIISLVRKPWAPEIMYHALETEKFVIFPWENK